MKIIRIYTFTLILLITIVSGCGFKPINQLDQENYFVKKIDLTGDKRIGYLIKNEILLNSSSSAERILNISFDVNKRKEIKEKSISGKISSYTLILNIDLIIEDELKTKEIRNTFTRSSSYDVASNHSDTLSNEKDSLENLAKITTEDIINFLTIYLKN